MTVLKAHFDGKVLIPEEPVDLPTDRVLEVHVEAVEPAQKPKGTLQRLAELAQKHAVTGGPSDGAAQHDHYLYGAPKRP